MRNVSRVDFNVDPILLPDFEVRLHFDRERVILCRSIGIGFFILRGKLYPADVNA